MKTRTDIFIFPYFQQAFFGLNTIETCYSESEDETDALDKSNKLKDNQIELEEKVLNFSQINNRAYLGFSVEDLFDGDIANFLFDERQNLMDLNTDQGQMPLICSILWFTN
jgi:hypothetical protein